MKKLLFTVLVVSIAWGAFAQSIDPGKIDMSKAELSLAGPNSVYVSNIYYGATRLSVLLKYDGQTGALIYGPYYDEDKFLLDSFELGYADLRMQGGDTLVVSDLILYGQGVSARFKYDGVYTLNLTSWWESETPQTFDAQISDLTERLATSQKRYEQELVATKGKYEADIAALTKSNKTMTDELAALKTKITNYDSQIAALKRSIPMASTKADETRLLENMMFAAPVDKTKIDLSAAMMHLAGPDAIYVTGISYDGTPISIILKYDGKMGAKIYGPYYENESLLMDTYELGYADMSFQGANGVIFSDLILNGMGITGRFEYDGKSTLNLTGYWASTVPKTNDVQIAELESEKGRIQARYDGLLTQYNRTQKSSADQIAALQAELKMAKAGGAVTTAVPTQSVLSGFARGTSLAGTWQASATSAAQSNSALLFAKYSIPLNQSAAQTLYSFTGQAAASATKFVGYGLHFFVSGDRAGQSYGLGSSYLVWITRDPGYYKNENTYVQLYRSYDDIKMLQVASVATSLNVSSANKVEVFYDKAAGKIMVSVNGTNYLNVSAPNAIASGNKVALRTLGGPVTFTQFDVKAK
jgi:hypothetical protein